jgi:hypothetical protein
LDLPLASLVSIVGKRKKLLTYTQETTRAKLATTLSKAYPQRSKDHD